MLSDNLNKIYIFNKKLLKMIWLVYKQLKYKHKIIYMTNIDYKQ